MQRELCSESPLYGTLEPEKKKLVDEVRFLLRIHGVVDGLLQQ